MSAPDPLTPPYCDLRGYEYMPLFGQKLFGSNLYAECTDEEFRAALKLWWEAWQQCPAGSLPAADHALARLADYGRDLKGWARIKQNTLRGFVLCADGRLYHPMLCEAAVKAYELRLKSDKRRETDRKRLQAWREEQRKRDSGDEGNGSGGGSETPSETHDDTPTETADETRFNQGVETPNVGCRREGKEEEKKEKQEPPIRPPSDAPPPAAPTRTREARGCRLPDDWQPTPADVAFASDLGLDVSASAAEFRDYWHGVPGAKGRKLDWSGTWRNRCRERAARMVHRIGHRRETLSEERRRKLNIPSIFDLDDHATLDGEAQHVRIN